MSYGTNAVLKSWCTHRNRKIELTHVWRTFCPSDSTKVRSAICESEAHAAASEDRRGETHLHGLSQGLETPDEERLGEPTRRNVDS